MKSLTNEINVLIISYQVGCFLDLEIIEVGKFSFLPFSFLL